MKQKEFKIGDLVTAPKRAGRYDVTREFEFAIVTVPNYLNNNSQHMNFVQVYLQETGSFKEYHCSELKLVHRVE